jgi:hypothetical protein
MPVVNTGTESNGISAHGTIIKRNGANIAELKDITPPALTRKAHRHDDSQLGRRQLRGRNPAQG